MVIPLLMILGFVVFCLWAYDAMIDIRPKVSKQPPGGDDGMVPEDLEQDLKAHVRVLAADIGPRNVSNPKNLDAAFRYLCLFWEQIGYEVKVETFQAEGHTCRNAAVEIPGGSASDEIVVVGAHYDSVGYSPGANDNGSAVASLLELSRLWKEVSPGRTIRFVAFVNEEPPFFKTGKMGSLVYAKGCRSRGEKIVAMVCLETIGYYRKEKGTQNYPFPLSAFYPDTGDFLAVVGNLQSKPLVQSFAHHFMEESDFPVQCAAPFGFIPGIDWSDHWSFWQMGYPAIMLTDTALFRYPYYHSVEDTPDKLDYHSLARVTHGIHRALLRLADHV
jgi:Zn-dependent M28 family amino/carboxypeptidase